MANPKKSALALIPAVAHAVAAAAQSNPDLCLPDPPPAVRQAVAAFEALIGGRSALIEALATAAEDPDIQPILLLLADPEAEDQSLPTLCRAAGVSPAQLFGAFEKAALLRGQLLSKVVAANAAPEVTQEIVTTAVTHEEFCPTCNGTGSVVTEPSEAGAPAPTPARCWTCQGLGQIKVRGQYDQQKTALEIAGVLKKGGFGVTIPVTPVFQNNFGPRLEQLQQAMSGVLYGRRGQTTSSPEPPPAAEAEILPPSDPPPPKESA